MAAPAFQPEARAWLVRNSGRGNMIDFNKALAFIKLCSKSGPLLFFEGRLGADRVPTIKDFMSDDPEKLEKCEQFIEYLEDVHDALTDGIRDRPRQTKLVPSADGSKLEVKGRLTNPVRDRRKATKGTKEMAQHPERKKPPAGKKKPPPPKKPPAKKLKTSAKK
jgi:hypothetical protein